MKKTQLAYAAGYIDGDGCFSIYKDLLGTRNSPRFPAGLIIASVNPDILYWLHENLGGSIQHNIKSKTERRKSVYYFHLRNKKAVPFIQKIIPYLVEKIDEAKTLIEFTVVKKPEEKELLIEKMRNIKNFTNLVSENHKEEFESLKNTIEPTEEDFAYLAGFIDAECCLGIQKYRDKNRPNYIYKIQLQCNNTKAPVFKWIMQRFGGQIHFIDRTSHDSTRRNQLTWRLTSAALANILNKIKPFLRHKKPVCMELIKFSNLILPNGGSRHTDIFRHEYDQIIAMREEIIDKVHLLNLKGNLYT